MIIYYKPEINSLSKAIGDWRQKKGFISDKTNVPEKIALIHSELSEALEEWRETGEDKLYICPDGKPEGFSIELADTVIRILDLCDALEIDLAEAIDIKMRYNETREAKHGKRF
jgi:NTP pyrophosphatase (non-canonical NTP hydrolase)